MSQVLKGRADFSLEQAEAVNTFLSHSDDEGEYFMLLLLKDRAGSEKLRTRFEKKIQLMREDHFNIKKRLLSSESISAKDRERFYSSSIYGAIHVLAAIPDYRSVEALAKIVRLSQGQVREVVDFMAKIGVLKDENGKISPGTNHVHLGTDSELILKHHCNWRLHTIANLQFLDRDDVHYSACLSLSKEDAIKVKESILNNLKQNIDTIAKSKEETAYAMCIDFYKLIT